MVKGPIPLFESRGDESFVLESSFFIRVSYHLNEALELQNKFVKQLKAVTVVRFTDLDFYLSPKGCLYRYENQCEVSGEKEICT